MIEKQIAYDHTIDEFGNINIRTITKVIEDDVELSKTYHRKVVNPNTDDLSGEDLRTRLLGDAISKELDEIRSGLKDSSEVSEGETEKEEEVKELTWTQRLKEFWSNLE